jgi:NADP-dependent 3-hydroxy acid dehydrogenase YdfG
MAFSDYKVALVTGASGGIGGSIVERLAQEGLEVHAVGRNKAKLDELASRVRCVPHVVDISDSEAYRKILESLEIDIMVNNAGVDHKGSISTVTANQIDEQVDVNFRAVLHGLRIVLPGMMDRDRGHIVNITSIAAIYPFASNAIYHATKAAVHALTNQLRLDVFGKRVRVTEICPARVATEIFGKVHGDPVAAKQKFIEGYELLMPEDVSDAIATVIAAPSHVNIGFMEIMPTFQVVGGLEFARHTAKSNGAKQKR